MAERLKAVEGLLRPLEDALTEHGITPSWWVGEMKDKAENAVITKTATEGGVITDEKEYADNRIRFESLRELGKVGRFYPTEKLKVDINDMSDEEIDRQLKELDGSGSGTQDSETKASSGAGPSEKSK